LTLEQAQQLGGRIRRGEQSVPVVFWKRIGEGEDLAKVTRPMLRYYRVFNTEQCEGFCQVVESLASLKQNNPDLVLFSVGTSDLLPNSESLVSKQAMMNCLEMVSTNPEKVLNLAMNIEKKLNVSH
jgi:hypothetical protein